MATASAPRARRAGRAAIAGAVLVAGCATVPAGPPVTAFDGTYAGTSRFLSNISQTCQTLPPITDFRVRDGEVTYFAFRGRIRPDGSVRMQAGDGYVEGRFAGGHFEGRTISPGGPCTYELSLNRVS
jgi:hypothetical protein